MSTLEARLTSIGRGFSSSFSKGSALAALAFAACAPSRDDSGNTPPSTSSGTDSSYTTYNSDDSTTTSDDSDSQITPGEAPYFTVNPIVIEAEANTHVEKNLLDYLVCDPAIESGTVSCTVDYTSLPQETIALDDPGCTLSLNINSVMAGVTYTLPIQATDAYGTAVSAVELIVNEMPQENHAPQISTTTLSSATTNTLYVGTINATDQDDDQLTYSLITAPSWLSIDSSSGELYGTPTTSGNESLSVSVTDGSLTASQTYLLSVNNIATLDMSVIDGDTGFGVDDGCNVEIVVTNSTSGKSYSATSSAGVASFGLDETGTYNVSVASTNTGSNCYGGFSQNEWFDISSGSNSSWVTLIPESYANDVVSVVGTQITTYRDGSAWTCDSVTDLVMYMSAVDSYSSSSASTEGWDPTIQSGARALEVEDFGGYTYDGINYDDALADAVALWSGSLAPFITIVPAGSGGDVYFTGTGNWQTDVNSSSSTGIISDVEISYGGSGSYGSAVITITHELGHSFFSHINVEGFAMESSPNVEPHELELLAARIYNNIGTATPTGNRIILYPIDPTNGYSQ